MTSFIDNGEFTDDFIDGTSMRPTLSDKQFVFSFVDFYKNNEINYGDIIF